MTAADEWRQISQYAVGMNNLLQQLSEIYNTDMIGTLAASAVWKTNIAESIPEFHEKLIEFTKVFVAIHNQQRFMFGLSTENVMRKFFTAMDEILLTSIFRINSSQMKLKCTIATATLILSLLVLPMLKKLQVLLTFFLTPFMLLVPIKVRFPRILSFYRVLLIPQAYMVL